MVFFAQKKEQKKKYWCKVLLIKQIRRMINQGSHAYTISIYYRTCNRNESTHIRTYTHTHIHIQLQTNQHTLLFTCDNRHLVIQNYHDTTPLSSFVTVLVLAISLSSIVLLSSSMLLSTNRTRFPFFILQFRVLSISFFSFFLLTDFPFFRFVL